MSSKYLYILISFIAWLLRLDIVYSPSWQRERAAVRRAKVFSHKLSRGVCPAVDADRQRAISFKYRFQSAPFVAFNDTHWERCSGGNIGLYHQEKVIFLALLAAAAAQEYVDSTMRVELTPPAETVGRSTRQVITRWITQPVDHFDPSNSDTFQMRYMVNDEFFTGEPGAPIFLMAGGEWSISPGWLQAGNMYESARENGGYLIYTEHRYYGQTLPYFTFDRDTLRFLNIDQALADLAYFIRSFKQLSMFANSKIVMFGGSYAANMVMWFKQRYPHLVEGVVASSGPILGEVDFKGYLEVVHDAFLSEGGSQCVDTIRQGIRDTVAAIQLQTPAGRTLVESAYRLCPGFTDFENVLDLGYFSGLITWTFSTSVQQARPGNLATICGFFDTQVFGVTPMQKIGGYIAWLRGLQSCWGISHDVYVNQYMVPQSDSKAWYYQTCTEYGYYQTAPTSGTVFDPLTWLDVNFYVDLCQRVFDERMDEEFVESAVRRVNTFFGGLSPRVNKTINIHGAIDPWHALGVVHEDIQPDSPTILVPRASHCFDLQSWLSTDTIMMTNAQQFARRLITEWLS